MKGFTLLEIVVAVTIISLLTLIVTAAMPAARAHQALRLAQQQVSDAFAQARHQALNEIRAKPCISQAAEPKRCSDVGVAVKNSKLVSFADTAEPQDWRYTEGRDYVISTLTLPAIITLADSIGSSLTRWRSWVFVGTPPTLQLYSSANPGSSGSVVTPGQVFIIMLKAGARRFSLTISSYGQVSY